MDRNLTSIFQTRQYMQEGAYEVFFYGDVKLTHVSAHSHDYYEFYFFLNGEVDYILGNQSFHLKYADMMIIPPGVSHKAFIRDSSVSYQRFVFWVKREFIEQLEIEDPEITFFIKFMERQKGRYLYSLHFIDFQTLISAIVELILETNKKSFCSITRGRVLAANVLVRINRMLYYLDRDKKTETGEELYLNIITYVTNNLTQELSLDRIADALFISKYHMARHFKNHMGISIHQYILNRRLDLAKVLILSGTPVSKVHQQCGFKDYATFFRAFKKGYGMAPAVFKEKYHVDSYFNPTGDGLE